MDTPRTTLVACVLQGNAAYWAHCGDSRLYLVRAGKLIARTRDHSYSELQETLHSRGADGERLNRNVLFTCLGSPGKPVVDTAGPLVVQGGDRVMLCSDGLWGTVTDDANHRSWPAADRRSRARTGGAGAAQRPATESDNVTVLAVEWEAPKIDSERHLHRGTGR
jgi:serine/threonine protein phosphatase PrpC